MDRKNKDLLEMVRGVIGLRARVREYTYRKRHSALLAARSIHDVGSVVVFFRTDCLRGQKREQFESWLKGFNDPAVPGSYRLLAHGPHTENVAEFLRIMKERKNA